jgi:hypothetical protein
MATIPKGFRLHKGFDLLSELAARKAGAIQAFYPLRKEENPAWIEV